MTTGGTVDVITVIERLTPLALAAALVAAGCSKASDSAKPAGPRDAVLDAWKADKIELTGLAPAPVAFAKDCQAGTVQSLDVLLCSFPTPAEAKAAEDPALAWIGAATGAAQAHGAALVVVADRKKADPNGRLINKLMKLAPK
jgi:hypothetical protein